MGYRVLVIDDSPVLRIMLTEMLKSLGHDIVAEGENGKDGIEKYRSLRPELVTLDISLPDMNGLEVLERLRKIDAGAKVLIVTGNDQKAVEQKALALKALAVLHKPFDEGELRATLDRIAPSLAKR